MTRKRTEAPAADPRAWLRYPSLCTTQLPNAEKSTGKEENQTYLKEGDIGEAESEEVVPVKPEQRSQVTLSL